MNMPFGKHKGTPISEIPNASLYFYTTKIQIKSNSLKKELEEEVLRRGDPDTVFLLAKEETIEKRQKENDERNFRSDLGFERD